MNSNKFLLFVSILFLIFSLSYNIHKENEEDIENFFKTLDFSTVTTYDDSNYVQRIKVEKPLFIYVYEPSCFECKQTIPVFISMSDFLKKNKTDLTMARVNARENPEFSKDYKIQDFPTLIYIGRDRKILHFKYEINEYNLLKFINKKLYGDALIFEEMADVNKTIASKKYKENQVFVLSTLAFDYKKDVFNKVAYENDREIFIQCFSSECYNVYNEDIVIYKNFDEKTVLYSEHFKSGSDRLDVDKINKFIMRYSVEAGGPLENEYFLLSKDYKRKMVIFFRDSKDENQVKYDKFIKEAGLELRKKVGYTFVSDIKGNEFLEDVAEDFVISPSELPTLLFVDKINLKERKKCKTFRITNVDLKNLNKEFVLKFAKNVQKNKVNRDLRTEFPPEKSDGPFKIVVGRTYDKEVVYEKKNVLIAFLDKTNKCDLCNKYLEVMKEFQQSNEYGDKIVFAVIDGSNNEARGISFKVNELPFIYFYTNGESNKSKYKYKPKDEKNISKEKLELFIKEALKGNVVKEDL